MESPQTLVGSLVVAWSIFTLGVTVAAAGRGRTEIHWYSALHASITCVALAVGVGTCSVVLYRLLDGTRMPGSQLRLVVPAAVLMAATFLVAFFGSHDMDIVDKPLVVVTAVSGLYLLFVAPWKRRVRRKPIAALSSARWHSAALVLVIVSAVTAGTWGIVSG